jgi:hypothetical protein
VLGNFFSGLAIVALGFFAIVTVVAISFGCPDPCPIPAWMYVIMVIGVVAMVLGSVTFWVVLPIRGAIQRRRSAEPIGWLEEGIIGLTVLMGLLLNLGIVSIVLNAYSSR